MGKLVGLLGVGMEREEDHDYATLLFTLMTGYNRVHICLIPPDGERYHSLLHQSESLSSKTMTQVTPMGAFAGCPKFSGSIAQRIHIWKLPQP